MAQLAQRMGMHRPGRHPRQPEPAEALHHLAGSLVRERYDEDLVRCDGAAGDGECCSPAYHPRLACSGTGNDRQWAIDGSDGLQLGLVEAVEEPICRGAGGHEPRLAAAAHRPINAARRRPNLRRTSAAAPHPAHNPGRG